MFLMCRIRQLVLTTKPHRGQVILSGLWDSAETYVDSEITSLPLCF